MTNTNGENVFNVSVNGISGVIEIPTGFYVGSTLLKHCKAESTKFKIPVLVILLAVLVVQYDSLTNNFTFTTGTTGNTSTIKVKGAARFGLDDVRLGVGLFPNLQSCCKHTTMMAWLLCDATWECCDNAPDNLLRVIIRSTLMKVS